MIAYIFPGQGAQFVGMGKDLYETFLSSREIFKIADKVLGFSISALCFSGPQDKLTSTENAQPAIMTVSIAALEALKEVDRVSHNTWGFRPAFVAGLSLGEYSALVAAKALSFEQAIDLVRKRGIYMQEAAKANPGKMLSIIGLSRQEVENICKDTRCEIANLNCPGQIVISGRIGQAEKAKQLAEERAAKQAVFLEVSGAFHSSLMQQAELKLANEINKVGFRSAGIAIVSNVTAKGAENSKEVVRNLIRQVSSCTYWEESIRFMASKGVDCFLEIGPGSVLRGLNRRINPELKTINIGTAEQVRSFIHEQSMKN